MIAKYQVSVCWRMTQIQMHVLYVQKWQIQRNKGLKVTYIHF